MTVLEQYIHSYFGVTLDDISKISSYFQLTTLNKGDYFLKAGQICNKLSFHKSGLIRVYVATEKKEVTQWISTQGYFVTDLAGIMFNKPTKYNIQALTDCELYTIKTDDYNRIGNFIPKWHQLEKLFIARCFTFLEDRIFMLLSMTAAERYKLFFENQKELFNQVPLQYIASMLGMTPETLSRLRKKKLE
ncbi:Crp/Fnr family transcriptional regulator [Mucilaginibacter arboris]|uniref:Cyclic nucleotide-binding domain-containing protein n=1 Tax=Mucilaginibacter arboris TaxID=2682090 RepID=A0A7K1SXH7_9SPHI|nr:Crp/Fnr family transcriptional regulator [Mucilaginibacter arboris]MVN22031.1 cyclic nucleotide-binding domain-containing protein [Mucilaginibacter arboris]